MATLTPQEIEYIRAMSGDTCGCDDPDDDSCYDVSDAFMQWLHDEKASLEPRCMSSDSLAGTIVEVLKVRVAKAQRLFDEDGENGTRRVSQKRGFLETDLKTWKEACGQGGSVITVSTFSLGLDVRCENPYVAYYGPWWWGS